MTNSALSVPKLVLVSGFLGAGKTSLLLAAGSRLRASGTRVGMITNDQGRELVDTRMAQRFGFETEEVTGGCFCCKFSEFLRAAQHLAASRSLPDIILCEPVGSCTDLVATIIRPLASQFGNTFRVAPLTVVIDPNRAAQLLASDADPNVTYLFQKQLAEADIALYSRSDLSLPTPALSGIPTRSVSAVTGEGIDAWMEDVLQTTGHLTTRTLEIDYTKYAAAEAALGWVNWRGGLRFDTAVRPLSIVEELLERLDLQLTKESAKIAHLKIYLEWKDGYIKASICNNGDVLPVLGNLDGDPAQNYNLTINIRAVADPKIIATTVDASIAALGTTVYERYLEAFRPLPPKPEFRMAAL